MATYTMELRTLIETYHTDIFDFDYAFYSDKDDEKKAFEELFINHFYYHEIGCETYSRWHHLLKSKLQLIMPYYEQLYQTEWKKVGKDMMNSKDLTETTIHTLTSNQSGTQAQQGSSESSSQSEGSGTETSEANAKSSGSGEVSNHSTDLESALENGVPQVHLETDLTRKAQSDSTSSSSSEASSQSDSNTTTSSNATASNHATNESTLKNQQENQLEEKTTFTSKGDIGIQTPAYAITEWRKVIINLNQMILEDLSSLFIQIY